MTTVLVLFDAAEGKADALREVLASGQPNVIGAGAKRIALYTDTDNPNRIVEIELWPSADGHTAMLKAMEESGVMAQLEALATGITAYYLDEHQTTEA